jgi:predicted O-linked N-acetylglucosamine transferase (SPINDLY family)
LTLAGETFAGRVASSLLTAIGLTELIAKSAQEYESLAIQLGHEPETIVALKSKLNDNRLSEPLFDTERYTEKLESAFREMHRRSTRNQPPTHLVIPP